MKIIKNIKKIFYSSALKIAVKKSINTKREMINIDFAKKIGIIYNATKTNDVITVNKFSESLKREKKEVFTLGYQDRKIKDEEVSNLFDNKNVNWYGIPNDKSIIAFQKYDLDILICAFEEESFPLEYIAATSNAKFRVGAYSTTKTNFYEFMVSLKQGENLSYLLNQILHFLKIINKNEK